MAEILAYVHKDGAFHRLHPVTKIVFIIAVSLAIAAVLAKPADISSVPAAPASSRRNRT